MSARGEEVLKANNILKSITIGSNQELAVGSLTPNKRYCSRGGNM